SSCICASVRRRRSRARATAAPSPPSPTAPCSAKGWRCSRSSGWRTPSATAIASTPCSVAWPARRVGPARAAMGRRREGRRGGWAPLPEGQARALRRAYERAGYGPETVELMEAHGTGTAAGDAAEFDGLRSVFDATGRADRQWCALGSVKSQIGHTKAAAGAAGLFKVIMGLHHRVVPPTIKISQPNPGLELERSPFYLNTEARPWIRHPDHPRRASVSSFGFGGSNFHVTLEEYTGPEQRGHRLRSATDELVLLSANTPAELLARCRELA